tara:strand:+ start:11994 stop:12944 length:951 start_codon:yes stop_codon:yes gene_type:complete
VSKAGVDAYCEDLGNGIVCIDANYVAPGMACFYLLEAVGEYALIETGTSRSVENLQRLLGARGIAAEQIRYIIPTHVHLDHAGGAGLMMQCFPGAQLLVHPRGERHMADPERLVTASRAVYGDELFADLYGEVLPVPAARILAMHDGDSVQLGDRRLEFRHTPGHALHHFCVWDAQSRGWFSGDMFGLCYAWCRFPGGDLVLPSTTPTQFDPEAYLASLTLLHSYAPRQMYLTHYGAIDYHPEKSRMLASQIATYRALAMAHESDAALEAALADDAVRRAAALGCRYSAGELGEKLVFDVQLNTQGLRDWQRRLQA